jgi:hypothetical protein
MNTNQLLVWNARGIDGRGRRSVVREFVDQHRVSVLCLQETKQVAPHHDNMLKVWWQQSRSALPGGFRQAFDSGVLLVTWCLWKECNRRTFDRTCMTATQLLCSIVEEANAWILAGVRPLSSLLALNGDAPAG